MAILPLRIRHSYHSFINRSQGPLFRPPFPSLPVSRTATLLFLTFALSLASVVLALVRYSSVSSRILFQLDVWSKPVYDPFTRPPAADSIADPTIRPIKQQSTIPDACLDQWISFGLWRASCIRVPVEESPIDLVYIWVNGSDVYHSEARADLLSSLNYSTKNARFRQHDELRYSMRSAFANTKSWKHSVWHVVTADVPDPDAFDDAERLGLVPQWLDVETAWAGGKNAEPPVYLYHDSELFRLTSLPGHTPTIEEVDRWRNTVLPTFNSMAVESQLPHLDPEIVSENIIYFNDDQFLMLPLPPSAFHSTLYGPVFRLYPGFMIEADTSGNAPGGGEWRSLGWSAHILNQRFGTRGRAYIGHNARSFSLPLMHEAALTFGDYFALTPMSQFRGSHDVGGEFEVNTIFTATHFVMERHREALLWSWTVAKWGRVADGMLDEELKAAMWLELGAEDDQDEFRRNSSMRTSNDDVALNMRAAGLEQPQSDIPEERANTTYLFVSLDGYTPNYTNRPQEGGLSRNECIGRDKETAWGVFRRLAVDKPHCGDAVITALTNTAPHGLSIFLPPHTSSALAPVHAVLPLIMPSTAPPLPENPRAFALRLIHRYAYVIAETPSAFFGVETADQGRVYFSWLHADTALLCVNDDLYDDALNVTRGDNMMRQSFRTLWPDSLSYEK
ncbi:hypothetical protein C8F04DRAFT_1145945 [Mycena alexandri]|uniref:Stealth protein CR3 conserved region 3 domain-containing protein n=1 Tax=Mycena alexandri TaxID=1745969 RepID=A0AAD6S4Y1_9AGAR|nr:hypothetical protein C8F04DRAFT_1145945 [Mycena alexandri]